MPTHYDSFVCLYCARPAQAVLVEQVTMKGSYALPQAEIAAGKVVCPWCLRVQISTIGRAAKPVLAAPVSQAQAAPARKADKGTHTSVYFTLRLRRRLGKYLLDRHEGAQRMRNAVIVEAVERFLKQEGF